MKRIIFIGLGLLAVLIVAVLAAPSLIDWNRFKPHIAQAVRDATGRELRIEGNLDISLLPAIEFSAADIHLANPPGFSASDFASTEAARARIKIWPLLGRRLVVEQFIVEEPKVALEVNESGRTNWAFESAKPAATRSEAGGGLPISDLRLDDVRLTDGAFSYHNALSGQDLIGRDLKMTASLPAIDGLLAVDSSWTLNDEPVTFDASVAPFEALFSDAAGTIGLKLNTKHLKAQLAAGVQVQPLVGLDGDASMDIPSVGSLAAWLDVPYDQDPGPLKLNARFKSDGAMVALQEATIEGDRLSARASASIDASGDALKVAANVESGVLDIDRYLPTMPENRGIAEPSSDGRDIEGPLKAVPDTPLDLSALRKLIADINISIDGIRLAGYAVGPIRLETTAKDGVLVGDLEQIGLYGGAIAGSLQLDASADTLGAQIDIEVANVDVGTLARAAAGDTPPPVIGIASGRFRASTTGRTARELTQNTIGKLDVSLQSQGGQGPIGQLTALSLAAGRPAVGAQLKLAGRAVYNKEEVTFDVVTDPVLAALLGGDPIALQAKIDSGLLAASYDGRIVQSPVASLDGTFDAKIASVGRFASWLGQPLPEGQADPGALEAHAVLESDGTTGKIDEAYLRGEGLLLDATGDFDASGDVTRFNIALSGGVLDLDRYLPAGGEPAAQNAERDGAPRASGDPLAALSEHPIDVTPLRQYAGQVKVALQGIKATGVEVGVVDLKVTLDNALLEVALDKVEVVDGMVTANASVDGSGDTLGIKAMVSADKLQTPRLDAALRGTGATLQGVASAEVALSSRGKSLRALATGATGNLKLNLPGVVFDQGSIASISSIDASVELPGVDANPKIKTTANLQARGSQKTVQFELSGQLGPLPKLLEGQEVPLEFAAKIGEVELQVDGRIAGLDSTPRPDLDIRLKGKQLSDLGVFTGGELPAVGPLSVAATVSTEESTYRVADLAVQLGQSDLSGNASIALGDDRPKLIADLGGKLIDVSELMPPEETPAPQPKLTEDTGRVIADDPLPPEETPAPQPKLTEDTDRVIQNDPLPPEEPPVPPPKSTEDTGRVIADDPLPLDALKTLDAEVTVKIAKLRTSTAADVENMNARITLANGKLAMAPVSGATAGGQFDVQLTLDGTQQPAGFQANLQAKQLLMGTFSELLQRSGESVGKLDADIELQGKGNTPHQIASSLNGRTNLIGAGGSVNSAVLKLLATGIGSIFDPFLGDQGKTHLNCFVVSFDFEDGIGTSRAILVDFPSMSVAGGGTVNLGDETLDLKFTTESKEASLMALTAPFNVGGSLASPTVAPDVAGTTFEAIKAAGIVVNPLVAVGLLAAVELLDAEDENPCVVAVNQAEGAEPVQERAPGDAESVGKDISERLASPFSGGKD